MKKYVSGIVVSALIGLTLVSCTKEAGTGYKISTGGSTSSTPEVVTAGPVVVNEVQNLVTKSVNSDPQYSVSNSDLDDLKSQGIISQADADSLQIITN